MLQRNTIVRLFRYLVLFTLLQGISLAVSSEEKTAQQSLNPPTISIIIDDIGYRKRDGNRAVNLPGDVTFAFLPHAPFSAQLAQLAHEKDREVMLHLPMQSEAGKKLGPGGLTEDMSEQQFLAVLKDSIESIPFASGFNNHMGSLLTKNTTLMKRVMQQVASNDQFFFVDSKTTSESVALQLARREGLRAIQRDIFIDHEPTPEFIQHQLKKLVEQARRKGTALGIAHPKKETLAILEQWLPRLAQMGVRLVPVSELIGLQQQQKIALWKTRPIKIMSR